MAFANSSVLVINAAGDTHSFATAQNSPLNIDIPAGSTGLWKWVVSRAGYSCQSGSFDTDGGGYFSGSPLPAQRVQASGVALYTATTNLIIDIVFDLTTGAETCFIDIGNGSASPQEIIDALEVALETEDGCKFLIAKNCSESTFAFLGGLSYLLLGSGYRLRRTATGDINATVAAFVTSVDGIPVDGVNGGINFLQSAEVSGHPFID